MNQNQPVWCQLTSPTELHTPCTILTALSEINSSQPHPENSRLLSKSKYQYQQNMDDRKNRSMSYEEFLSLHINRHSFNFWSLFSQTALKNNSCPLLSTQTFLLDHVTCCKREVRESGKSPLFTARNFRDAMCVWGGGDGINGLASSGRGVSASTSCPGQSDLYCSFAGLFRPWGTASVFSIFS